MNKEQKSELRFFLNDLYDAIVHNIENFGHSKGDDTPAQIMSIMEDGDFEGAAGLCVEYAFNKIKLQAKTRSVEVLICHMDRTWTTDFVEVPIETPSAYIEDIARKTAEDNLNIAGRPVAYIGIYNIPEIEED